MKAKDIQHILEAWAPRHIAWESDNVGLQVGDPELEVRGVLVALDATERVVKEATRRNANLIVSHHPLLFRPPKAVSIATPTGRCIHRLATSGVTLLSAHTNLDFTEGGTSHALAETLGLTDVDFLRKPYRVQRKIVTFVPADHVDTVAQAMALAGAGRIGNYESCSFRSPGTGTFRGNEAAHPAVGRAGTLESVAELRLEMIAEEWNVDRIIDAMRKAHPYEEPAYDVYPLHNASNSYGMGAIGSLHRPTTFTNFLSRIKRDLGIRAVRFTPPPRRTVHRVALCGGSGAELVEDAIHAHADVFVTADIRYHTFQEAAGRIALVDAGHFETEWPVVGAVAARLKNELHVRGARIPVFPSRITTNPVHHF